MTLPLVSNARNRLVRSSRAMSFLYVTEQLGICVLVLR